MSIVEERKRAYEKSKTEKDQKGLRAYQMACAGYSRKEIAKALDVSEVTAQVLIGRGKWLLTL